MNVDPRLFLNDKAAGLSAGLERINGAAAALEDWIHSNDAPDWFPEFARRTIAEARAVFETELVRLETVMIAMNNRRGAAMHNGADGAMPPSDSDLLALIENVELLPRMTPEDLVAAAKVGNASLVRLMLRDPRVELPIMIRGSAHSAVNDALLQACVWGNTEVVKILLRDGRADPGVKENNVFITACIKGHVGVVELLLQDGRVDPTDRANFGIYWACKNGHTGVVDLLLRDHRIIASLTPSNRDSLIRTSSPEIRALIENAFPRGGARRQTRHRAHRTLRVGKFTKISVNKLMHKKKRTTRKNRF